MSRRRQQITRETKQTTADYVATACFWGLVLGWPLFVVVWRCLK
jgi:hypothetical protein